MHKILLLSLAGGLGALSRYWLAAWVQRACGPEFPYGTLAVNLLGCLLFGFVWSLADDRQLLRAETRFLILTGFVGAFTTFSTFAFDSAELLRDHRWAPALLNILAQNLGGIAAIALGIATGRLL